jgi:TetR/AcrR family transcriptional repressor of nem operon
MPRHREFDIDEVTHKALKVFSERGYSHTSMSDLVEATGVRAGSLHVAYGNKEDVFIECLKKYGQKMHKLIPIDKSGMEAIKEVLENILRISLPGPDFMSCPGMHSSNAFSEMSDFPEKMFEQMMQDFNNFLTEKLKEAQEENEIRTDLEPRDLALLIMATLYGVRMMGYDEAPPKTLKSIVSSTIILLKK